MDHVCGLQGWDPRVDPPCPACEGNRRLRALPQESQRIIENVMGMGREMDDYARRLKSETLAHHATALYNLAGWLRVNLPKEQL